MKTADNLKEHTQSKHEGVMYYCDQCEYSTSRKRRIRYHQQFKHCLPGSSGFPFNCTQCEHGTTSKYLLTKQQKSKHEDIIYFCNQCKYKTEMQSDLKKHQLTEH